MKTYDIYYDYEEDDDYGTCHTIRETYKGTYEGMRDFCKNLLRAGYFNIEFTCLEDEMC